MNSLHAIIEEQVVQGHHPIHRTAYLGDEFLVTAQGTSHMDRWVLGWPTDPQTDWKDVIQLATDGKRALLPSIHGFVLYDDRFIPIGHHGGGAINDFEVLLNSRAEQPDLLVLDSIDYQMEVIFGEDNFETATISLMTKSNFLQTELFTELFQAFHFSTVIRNSESQAAAELLRELCGQHLSEAR